MKQLATLFIFFFLSAFIHVQAKPNAVKLNKSQINNEIFHRAIIYLTHNNVNLKTVNLTYDLPGFTRVEKFPAQINHPIVTLETTEEFKDAFPPPSLQLLAYFGRGLSKSETQAVQTAKAIIIATFAYPKSNMINGLKKSNEFVYKLAKQFDGFIWDSETRELFTLETWKTHRLEAWTRQIPLMEKHTVIHAYNNEKYVRAITLGMAKFGLPDIVVNDFSWSLNRQVGNLINIVGQSLLEGQQINQADQFIISLSDLANTSFKKDMSNNLKENAVDNVTLQTTQGEWEEGDPYNALLELKFDNFKGKSLHERQIALLSKLFGWEDKISYVQHNKQLEAASQKAKQQLPKLKKDFNEGLAPGEFIQVKAPFKTPEGGNEWMWVEIISWKKKQIQGLLKNQPYHIPDLKAGTMVNVNQDDIFDYIRTYPDGRSEGNETSKLIQQFQEN